MLELKNKLIVALDVDTLDEASRFVNILYPKVKMFKVGSQLFTACGPAVVEMIGKRQAKVFLDLKWHDIPNTVFLSSSTGTSTGTNLSFQTVSAKESSFGVGMSFPVFMMTVHTQGGKSMLGAAVKGATEKAKELKIKRPFIVGVTTLTSQSDEGDIQAQVLDAARLARDAGLDGVVCAVGEAAMIRKEFGKDFIIVTPGIRPKGYPSDDQSRVATAEAAIKAGADYIVVGRPILKAKDPLKAIEDLL